MSLLSPFGDFTQSSLSKFITTKEVVFVDVQVENFNEIEANIRAQMTGVEVFRLNDDRPGITQIADILGNFTDLKGVHIISHGAAGTLSLGQGQLNAGNLGNHEQALTQIGQSLSVDGDILLYGCDVGAGEEGRDFIDQLSRMTGADVAASNDLTGAAEAGGDWDLEVSNGLIDSQSLTIDALNGTLAYGQFIVGDGSGGGGGAGGNIFGNLVLGGVGGAGGGDDDSITGTDNNDVIVGDGSGGGGGATYTSVGGAGGAAGGGADTLTGGGGNDILFGDGFAGGAGDDGTSGQIYQIYDGGRGGLFGGGGGSYADLKNSVVTEGNSYAGYGGGTSANPSIADNNGNSAAGGANSAYYYARAGGGGFGSSGVGASVLSGAGGNGDTDEHRLTDNGTLLIHSKVTAILSTLLANNSVYGAGADVLDGGAGSDQLFGLGGDDLFVFELNDAGSSDTDTIWDFRKNGETAEFLKLTVSGQTLTFIEVTNLVAGQQENGNDRTLTFTNGSDKTVAIVIKDIGRDLTTADFLTAPAIGGVTASTTINDAETTSPFSAVTINDGENVTVTVSLDTAAKGAFTAASLTASGFTDNGDGSYSLASTTSTAAQTAIRQLVFDPTDNRVAVTSTENTTFTITVSDGTNSSTDNTTVVTSTSVNDAPTDIAIDSNSVNQSGGSNAVIGTLSATDVDPGDTAAFTLIAGDGDTNNGSFNISGTSLRANDSSSLTAGTYTIRVQVVDGSGAIYQEALSINVIDDVDPVIGGVTPLTVIDDTATATPFASVTIADLGTVSVTVTPDAAAKGTFTADSLLASGFTNNNDGTYSLASTTAALAQAAIRQLVFDPTDNRVAPGATENTTFTISVSDGTNTGTSNITVVTSTSVNDAPTDIALDNNSVNQSGGANASVGTLSVTDADTGDEASFTLVSGDGDANNALFNIAGTGLRANDAAGLASGTYSIRVQVDDGDATYQESFSITVADDRAPTVTALSPIDGGSDVAIDSNLTITFSEAVSFGTGNIVIRDTTGEATSLSIDVTNSNGVASINGNVLTINPAGLLEGGSEYYVQIDAGALVDATGKAFAGISDTTSWNFVTSVPTITSATYDAATGQLVVTGNNIPSSTSSDIDARKFTLSGEGGATFTLFSTSSVERDSATQFTLTLSESEKDQVNRFLNNNGTEATDGTVFNLVAADRWAPGAVSTNHADGTNAITVMNVAMPTITSATYDTDTGVLLVTGTGLISESGSNNDIDLSKLTFTGLAGATYTLTTASDVDITNTTSFTVTLSGADKTAVDALFDVGGPVASDDQAYLLAAAEDWIVGAAASVTDADLTGNGITVSGPTQARITSSTYDYSTGTFVVTGEDLVANGNGADIDASLLTFTGVGGVIYRLTDTTDVEIDSATQFTLTLSEADKAGINAIINKTGTSAFPFGSGEFYNLAAEDDFNTGFLAGVSAVQSSSVAVSNVTNPTITSATYDGTTGILIVTGMPIPVLSGPNNDIVVSRLTLTGEGGATYTLTSDSVDRTDTTSFQITLNATDKVAVDQLLNKAGLEAADGTTAYNIAAENGWTARFNGLSSNADLTDNPITVSFSPTPTPGPTPSPSTTETVDGVTVTTTTNGRGQMVRTFTPVASGEGSNETKTVSLGGGQGQTEATVGLPSGFSMTVTGNSTPSQIVTDGATGMPTHDLLILSGNLEGQSDAERNMVQNVGQQFLNSVQGQGGSLVAGTVLLTGAGTSDGNTSFVFTGSTQTGSGSVNEAFVIDTRQLPQGTTLQLDNIEFASIMGNATVMGGAGQNIVVGDDDQQFIMLGADDDQLFGGGGNDTIGSAGGDDLIYGNTGDDVLFGGAGADQLHGGTDTDVVTYDGRRSDYLIEQTDSVVTVTLIADPTDIDRLINVETIRFADDSLSISYNNELTVLATLYQKVLDRQADLGGIQFWAGSNADNTSVTGSTVYNILTTAEIVNRYGVNLDQLGADLTNNQAISFLYDAVLDRSADDVGLAYWSDLLESGARIQDIAATFLASAEFNANAVGNTAWEFFV